LKKWAGEIFEDIKIDAGMNTQSSIILFSTIATNGQPET